jgi:hypothetical protein
VDDLVRSVGGATTAQDACVIEGRASACLQATAESTRVCLERCIEARDAAVWAEVEKAAAACVKAYIQGNGKRTHECRVSGASEDHGEDVEALGKQLGGEARKAQETRDGAALDKTLRQLEALERLRRQRKCTTACRKQGPEMLAAASKAPALITAYKRCMVNADSTHEARKLAAFERDLYCGYLARANTRCRAANRCDWVEEHLDAECTYVSPGIGDCALSAQDAE